MPQGSRTRSGSGNETPEVNDWLAQNYPDGWPKGTEEYKDEEILHCFRELRQWVGWLAKRYGNGGGPLDQTEPPAQSPKHKHAGVQATIFEYLDEAFLSAPFFPSLNGHYLGGFEEYLWLHGIVPGEEIAAWRSTTLDLDIGLSDKTDFAEFPRRQVKRIEASLMRITPSIAYLSSSDRRKFEEHVTEVCTEALHLSLQMRRCKTRSFKINIFEPGTLINADVESRINVRMVSKGKEVPSIFRGGKIVRTTWGGLTVEDVPLKSAAGRRVLEKPWVIVDPM